MLENAWLNASFGLDAPAARILLGDIDADGAMEIIAVHPDGETGIGGLSAYRLDGARLWDFGEHGEPRGGAAAELPAQLFDIDGDGALEIVCVIGGKIVVLNGAGQLKREARLPGDFRCVSLSPASFTRSDGLGLLLSDEAGGLLAFDADLGLLWNYKAAAGCRPLAGDFNLDGLDEVMTGSALLDSRGGELARYGDPNEAPNCLWSGYFDLDPLSGVKFLIGRAGKALMTDMAGNELMSRAGRIGRLMLAPGRFADSKAFSIATLSHNMTGPDSLCLTDIGGHELARVERDFGSLPLVDAVRNFDRTGAEYILAYCADGSVTPSLYNGKLEEVYRLPEKGFCVHADLTGCGTEDILICSGRNIKIYSGESKSFAAKALYPPWQTKRLADVSARPGGEAEHWPLVNEKAYPPRNLRRGDGPVVFLMGDSTVCPQREKPFYGWGQVLPEFFEDTVQISNYAVSGRAFKSFIWEGHYARVIRRYRPGDYVFIQFGHNDQKPDKDFYCEAFGDYSGLLRLFVRHALAVGVTPLLISSMERRVFSPDGKVLHSHGDYPEAVRRVAEELGAAYLDLNAESKKLYESYGPERTKALFAHLSPGESPSFPDGLEDNTHFRYEGAKEIARIVCAGIRGKLPGLAGFLRGTF